MALDTYYHSKYTEMCLEAAAGAAEKHYRRLAELYRKELGVSLSQRMTDLFHTIDAKAFSDGWIG